jgi:hypothetical protein
VADDAYVAGAAAAVEGFAAVVSGDADLVAAALGRRGLSPAHRVLLAAWAARAGLAEPTTGPIPAEAASLLFTALEALVRVQDFDAFATLLPLADDLDGLAARNRRELLAGMYLRRGFLDSAAEEWAAAVDESGPDADALAGLSRVAAARGDVEDAQVFADAAEELRAAAA